MAPKIYKSPYPDIPVIESSIFTRLFSSAGGLANNIGDFPGETPAYTDAETGVTLTRAQTKGFALSLAWGLKNDPNTQAKRGETVMIYSGNSLAFPIALFGSVAAGLKVTLANNAYNARELAFQYTDSSARLLFTSEEGVPVMLEMFKQLGVSVDEVKKRVIILPNSLQWAGGVPIAVSPAARGFQELSSFFNRGWVEEEEKFDGKLSNETVYLCYSSGTTGKPKGVETTHRNIVAVLDQVKPAFSLEYGTDIVIGVLPFYHIYGAVKLVHFPFLRGVPLVIMSRFDPVQFCANIEKYKITTSLIVPPVLVALARHPVVDKFDLSSLTTLFSGAAPLGAALSKQVQDRLAKRAKGQLHILQGYGLTETSPTTHVIVRKDGNRKLGSIGQLLSNLELRLVVDGDGDGNIDAEEGQPGEIWIRGPSIMKGYLNNPTATKESITPDGWFKTGDIGIRDSEGFYYIVDRRKELIKYKGFQVPPAELESVLLTHPDIADTAVIAVESAREATELPRAYVVHAKPQTLKTEADKQAFAVGLQKWIQSKVARHKFLRGGVVVIDAIPKSPAGKILRRELKVLAKKELAGRDPADDIVKTKL